MQKSLRVPDSRQVVGLAAYRQVGLCFHQQVLRTRLVRGAKWRGLSQRFLSIPGQGLAWRPANRLIREGVERLILTLREDWQTGTQADPGREAGDASGITKPTVSKGGLLIAMTALRIAPVEHDQQAAMRHLLEENRLPLAGLECDLWRAWLAWKDETPIACAGLERYGERALLRSVAVAAAWHRRGIGSQLVRAVLQQAQALGLKEIYLLTEGAEPFFERLGFRQIAREDVPEALHASEEWNGACPQTATVMRLNFG